jgi:hypothetical protein
VMPSPFEIERGHGLARFLPPRAIPITACSSDVRQRVVRQILISRSPGTSPYGANTSFSTPGKIKPIMGALRT